MTTCLQDSGQVQGLILLQNELLHSDSGLVINRNGFQLCQQLTGGCSLFLFAGQYLLLLFHLQLQTCTVFSCFQSSK